jgi:hypothetical protein
MIKCQYRKVNDNFSIQSIAEFGKCLERKRFYCYTTQVQVYHSHLLLLQYLSLHASSVPTGVNKGPHHPYIYIFNFDFYVLYESIYNLYIISSTVCKLLSKDWRIERFYSASCNDIF